MLLVEVLIADVLAVLMLVKETLEVLVVVMLADVLEASKCCLARTCLASHVHSAWCLVDWVVHPSAGGVWM